MANQRRKQKSTKPQPQKTGMPPGTAVYVGEQLPSAFSLQLVEYDAENFEEKHILDAEQVRSCATSSRISWLNIDGVSDISSLRTIAGFFTLHPLLLEDIANTNQRPKCEEYPEHLFFVLRMFRFAEDREIISEQVSLVLGKDYVLSFQESQGDVFEPIRDRLRHSKGRVRNAGADYLAYALIDVIVDHYFLIMEHFEERLEGIEDELMQNPQADTLQRIYQGRREALDLRRAIWPLREALANLAKTDSPLLAKETRLYLRDAMDHAERVIEAIELYRETVATMTEIYLGTMSERLNQQTKMLTIIATIFIPLTFIAGVYGMNFRIMPELEWRYGYFLVLAFMAAVALGMLYYFRRRGWL